MRALVFALLCACATTTPVAEPPDAPEVELESPTASVEPAVVPEESPPAVLPPPSIGVGNIIVTQQLQPYGNPIIDLRAGFMPPRSRYLNWVECALVQGLCIEREPTQLDVGVDVPGELTFSSLPTLQAIGGNLRVGPYTTNSYVSQDNYYWGEGEHWETGPLDLSWGAGPEWPAYEGTAVFPMAEQLEGVSPRPGGTIIAQRDGVFEMTWTPGKDPVQLDVIANRPGGRQLRRTFALEDDGHFALDIAELKLHPDDRDLTVQLSRVRYATVHLDDNPVSLVSRSEAAFYIAVPDPRRTLVRTGWGCENVETLTSGRYHGPTPESSYLLEADCAGYRGYQPEAIFAVDVEPGEQVVARSSTFHDTYALLYFSTDCHDTTTCLTGKHRKDTSLAYVNESDVTEHVFVVVEGHRAGGWFELDLEIREVPNPIGFATSCEEAALMEPVVGPLSGNFTGAEDVVVPPNNEEVLAPIVIPPGERLRVHRTGQMGTMRLFDGCDSQNALAHQARWEVLEWINHGSEPMHAILSIEPNLRSAQSITIDVEIYPTEPIDIVDTCADLPDAPLLSTGIHHLSGSTAGLDNHIDLAEHGLSCTSEPTDGAEGLVRVHLEPGETIQVDYWVEGGVGAAYLLNDCNAPESVQACNFIPMEWSNKPPGLVFDWTNDGAVPLELVLVLDNWVGGSFGSLFYLDVTID